MYGNTSYATNNQMPGFSYPSEYSNKQEPPDVDPRTLPSAPMEEFIPSDTTGLANHAGYQNIGFEASHLQPPPPTYDECMSQPKIEIRSSFNMAQEDARAALLQHVSEKCCYRKEAAEKMIITNIDPTHAYHYILETFCEARTTTRKEVPYFGGNVDGPFNGPPPMPWTIWCVPSANFVDEVKNLTVPHTDEVRLCSLCCGVRFVQCNVCYGARRRTCFSCGGSGHRGGHHHSHHHHHHETCTFCHGSGSQPCSNCAGCGVVKCPHCKGAGSVKNFIELTVTFTNHKTDYIMANSVLPHDKIRKVSGECLLQLTSPQVPPIVSFHVQEINDNSVRLVQEARTSYPTERQIIQRQTLREVPIWLVNYQFKEYLSEFHVFGTERKVYAPGYPQQCCCTIL